MGLWEFPEPLLTLEGVLEHLQTGDLFGGHLVIGVGDEVELGGGMRRQDLLNGGALVHRTVHNTLLQLLGGRVDVHPFNGRELGDILDIAMVALVEIRSSPIDQVLDSAPLGHLGPGLGNEALDGGDQALRHVDEGLEDLDEVDDEADLNVSGVLDVAVVGDADAHAPPRLSHGLSLDLGNGVDLLHSVDFLFLKDDVELHNELSFLQHIRCCKIQGMYPCSL